MVLGGEQTRYLFGFLMAAAVIMLVGVALETGLPALLGLAFLATAVPATRSVLSGADGRALIPVLQQVGVAEILYAAGLFLGIAFS